MDQATYARWWPLHLRVARGETLSAEEQTVYQAGLEELDREERLALKDGWLEQARSARAAIATLKEKQARLQAEREKLEAQIAALEALLDERTREALRLEE